MRHSVIACTILMFALPVLLQNKKSSLPPPDQFEIGIHTFFDFGPPFDFYELLLIRPTATGTAIERITLTPAGDECFMPAKIEIAIGATNESPAEVLGSPNPCKIPDKALRRELKRCKNCLVFSGANVMMQVQCGRATRLIRSHVLDREMFDSAAATPEHTSWTMRLIDRLEKAVGPGVMDKPIFPMPESEEAPSSESDSPTLRELSQGKFDALFNGAPDKPSDVYRAAHKVIPPPTVSLRGSLEISPESLALPKYPPIARVAHIEGPVSIKFELDADGSAITLSFDGNSQRVHLGIKFRQRLTLL
ncbi:MAG: hypothetical protein HY046_03100 [Acidobacteria bacterium]|nr:hypothetical protein [Acidobacteriota bacterium]